MILQRASAGSGKTFKLAKTYIRLFIARREEGDTLFRLLPKRELRESHARILGVTFTNKATNEMKDRIVSKLAALAATHPEPGCEPAGWKPPDYLLDFTGENPKAHPVDDVIYRADDTPATRQDISLTCQAALRALLNDYGHFNISTIDTFFQGVLRTFAYELRLNDNYHVELNDDYLARVGLDQTLSMVNNTAGNDEELETAAYVTSWAKATISECLSRGEDWNMFNKSASSEIYSRLYSLARCMNRENFKMKVALLDDYFTDISRFTRFLTGCISASRTVHTLFAEVKDAKRRLMEAVEAMGPAEYNGMSGAWAMIDGLKPYSPLSRSKLGAKLLRVFDSDPDLPASPGFLKKSHPGYADPEILTLFSRLGTALYRWNRERDYRTTVLSRLHYLGMLHYIRRSTELFRSDNNIIPLSETNDILRRIINRDDTPFIYERIGTRLHHYLLDEFQDTSTMQWENLRPLLQQSTDQGDECLIIGDAKQSIYRFRNAEPDIINRRVAAAIPLTRVLPDPHASAEQCAEVNTNWRSADLVVRTNNSIFTLLPRLLDSTASPYLTPLYAGAAQTVKKIDLPGYVNISFRKPLGAEWADEGVKVAATDYYSNLGPLISSIIARGYHPADIAILVDFNSDGAAAIASLLAYNQQCSRADDTFTPIEILSEESLRVSDSAAVKVILAVLQVIARGFRLPDVSKATAEPAGEGVESEELPENSSKQVKQYELAQFVANFHCYLAEHPGEPLDSVLRRELDDMLPPERIWRMLSQMQATTLPAIVEAVAAAFTTTLGSEQAAYIAAFQDAVLEYCENYPADVASFLAWWEENVDSCSIAAPEGIDAVKVMTIHKSKGLEFPVVIIPKAMWNPYPSAKDCSRALIWTDHTPRGLGKLDPADIPAVMPITPSLDMAEEDSPFHTPFEEFARERVVDQLNKTYVAFTRAVSELHVFAPIHSTPRTASVLYIGDYINSAASVMAEQLPASPDAPLLLAPGEFNYVSGEYFVAGAPTEKSMSAPGGEHAQTADDTGVNADVILIDTYARPGAPARMHTAPEEQT